MVALAAAPLAETLDLTGWDAGMDLGLDHAQTVKEMRHWREQLHRFATLLAGAQTHGVLVVLQGMDAAGKDAAIRQVFSRVEHGPTVTHYFRVPTGEEQRHDFLWRVHQRCPARGQMVFFHRSHYEDVLAPRVHGLLTPDAWTQRYRQINDFERMLSESGTILLKFFLHLSYEEQGRRLATRGRSAQQSWKLSASDWAERWRWTEYQQAYADLLAATSTPWAPWQIVPADRKWVRNAVIAQASVERLAQEAPGWLYTLRRQHQARKQPKLASPKRL